MASTKSFVSLLLIVFTMWTSDCLAEDTAPAETKHKNWKTILQIAYSPRAMDGTIRYNKGGPSDYLATADTLGLGTVDSLQYVMAFKYKRWTLGVNYAPVTFNGDGYAYDLIKIGNAGVVGKVKVETSIDVDLILGSVMYDVIHEKHLTLSLGIGMGASIIDVALSPKIASGRGLTFDDTTPYGFLSINMQTNYRKFLFGVNVNGIDFSTELLDLGYLDIAVNAGYTILSKPFILNIIAGYRQVQFTMETRYAGEIVETAMDLTGPILGLRAIF